MTEVLDHSPVTNPEAPQQPLNRNELLVQSLRDIEWDYVPESIAEAQETMDEWRQFNTQLQDENYQQQQGVEAETATQWNAIAEKGMDYWRLDDAEREDMITAAYTPNINGMPEWTQSWLRNMKPEEGPITMMDRLQFQEMLVKRLKIDKALRKREHAATEGQAETPQPKAQPGHVGSARVANGKFAVLKPHVEVDRTVVELEDVSNDYNQMLEKRLEHMLRYSVPKNAEDAQAKVNVWRDYNKKLQDPAYREQHAITEATAERWQVVADVGLDHWRLNDAQREDMAQAVRAESAKDLLPHMRAWLRDLKGIKHGEVIGERDFKEFHSMLSKRMLLDRELSGIDAPAETDPVPDEPQAPDVKLPEPLTYGSSHKHRAAGRARLTSSSAEGRHAAETKQGVARAKVARAVGMVVGRAQMILQATREVHAAARQAHMQQVEQETNTTDSFAVDSSDETELKIVRKKSGQHKKTPKHRRQ